MTHIDLFSGIGGFSYAADQVWPGIEHIFVEIDPFCQQVLKKHWPNSKIYGDIRTFANTASERQPRSEHEKQPRYEKGSSEGHPRPFILTGGFPCQPFSQAGQRKGTKDDRHLWPEMLRVIQLTKPEWVIAENVRGLLTIQGGLVFEQVCLDLEAAGYAVQPFIIPAVAVNAPHRRDRVWFIGHAKHNGRYGSQNRQSSSERSDNNSARENKFEQPKRPDTQRNVVANRSSEGLQGSQLKGEQGNSGRPASQNTGGKFTWDNDWIEVATRLCRVDDGLSVGLDGFKLTKAQHRVQRLKALGNAIVPQVAIEIMKSIKYA